MSLRYGQDGFLDLSAYDASPVELDDIAPEVIVSAVRAHPLPPPEGDDWADMLAGAFADVDLGDLLEEAAQPAPPDDEDTGREGLSWERSEERWELDAAADDETWLPAYEDDDVEGVSDEPGDP